jgi:hypothetical protein
MNRLDAAAIGREAGVDFSRARDPGERIESHRAEAILRKAARLIPDDAFGLLAAACWHPANLGALGHAWLASTTLRSGLMRLGRYWRLVSEDATITIEETRSGITISHRARTGSDVAPIVTDMTLAVILDMCRMNAGASLHPIAVGLQRKRPVAVRTYERFYGCPVLFGKEANSFVLLTADVDRPLPSSNDELAAVFDRLLSEEAERLDRRDRERAFGSVFERATGLSVAAYETQKQ